MESAGCGGTRASLVSSSPFATTPAQKQPIRLDHSSPSTSSKRKLSQRDLVNGKGTITLLHPKGIEATVLPLADLVKYSTVASLIRYLRDSVLLHHERFDSAEKLFLTDRCGKLLADHEIMHVCSDTQLLLRHKDDVGVVFPNSEMWDCTPEECCFDRLKVSFERDTALAEMIDNALQAVWANEEGSQKLIRVQVDNSSIEIFDTGRGMDASQEKSLEYWGRPGASQNREAHAEANWGEPPFIKPVLGMYGIGSRLAWQTLGTKVEVSSKTCAAELVSVLFMNAKSGEQGATVNESPKERFKESGAIRDMTAEEKSLSPHGSFTKIRIAGLKDKRAPDVEELRKLLKDIYELYVLRDRVSREEPSTSSMTCDVIFEVNGKDLTSVYETEYDEMKLNFPPGGEKPLTYDVKLTRLASEKSSLGDGWSTAHAQLNMVYMPFEDEEEGLERVLSKVGSREGFEEAWRVRLRWLGRGLPRSNRSELPFMRPQRKKAQLRYLKRVRCVIDLDGGFQPTSVKTELEKTHPFTEVLLGLGDQSCMREDVKVEIFRDGSSVPLSKLHKVYLAWVQSMNLKYDHEVRLKDEPTFVTKLLCTPQELGIGFESKVACFYKHALTSASNTGEGFKLDEEEPVRIKIQKGFNKAPADVYATLEFFYHDGTEDDQGPVNVIYRLQKDGPDEECSSQLIPTARGEVKFKPGQGCLYMRATCLNNPQVVILSKRDWQASLNLKRDALPGSVDIMEGGDAREYATAEAFPADGTTLPAGAPLPNCVCVFVRPRNGKGPKDSTQNWILANPPVVQLKEEYRSKPGGEVEVAVEKNTIAMKRGRLAGLYFFKMKALRKAGDYTFTFEVKDQPEVTPCVRRLSIGPSPQVGSWAVCNHPGECERQHSHLLELPLFQRSNEVLYISQGDLYGNALPFKSAPPQLKFRFLEHQRPHKMIAGQGNLAVEYTCKVVGSKELEIRKLLVKLKEGVKSFQLPKSLAKCFLRIMPPDEEPFRGLLASKDDKHFAEMLCSVQPGPLAKAVVLESKPQVQDEAMVEALKPGQDLAVLKFKLLDMAGNAVKEGTEVAVKFCNFAWLGRHSDTVCADKDGVVDLSGIVVVKADQFGATGSLTLRFHQTSKPLLSFTFRTVTRALRAVTQLSSQQRVAGEKFDVEYEVVDPESLLVDNQLGGSLSVQFPGLEKRVSVVTQGRCSLAVEAPKQVGRVKGELLAQLNGAVLKDRLQLELVAGPAVQFKLSEITFQVASGTPCMLPFRVFDQHALLTSLKEEEIKELKPAAPPELQVELLGVTRPAGSSDYMAELLFTGSQKTFRVGLEGGPLGRLSDRAKDLPAQQWTVVVTAGPVHSLECFVDDEPAPEHFTVARFECLPVLKLRCMDEKGGVCRQYNGPLVKLGVSRGNSTRRILAEGEVVDGEVVFGDLKVDLEPGMYAFAARLQLGEREQGRLKCFQGLKVVEGNYPERMEVYPKGGGPDDEDPEVHLTNERVQVLPKYTVKVFAADGDHQALLERIEPVHLRVRKARGGVSVWSRHQGSYDSDTGLYEFTQVPAPTVTGTYDLEFELPPGEDVALEKEVRAVTIKHGYLAALELGPDVQTLGVEGGSLVSGDAPLVVLAKDRYGNLCDLCCKHRVRLRLEGLVAGLAVPGLEGRQETVLEHGVADFGVVRLGGGQRGSYLLRCEVLMKSGSVMARCSAQLTYYSKRDGEQGMEELQKITWELEELSKAKEAKKRELLQLQGRQNHLQQEHGGHERALQAAQAQMANLQSTRLQALANKLQPALIQQAAHSSRQPLRSIKPLSNFARVVAEGATGSGFHPLDAENQCSSGGGGVGQKVLGVLALLGRFEDPTLNARCAEFLGAGTMSKVIVRAQEDMALLEYKRGGVIDRTRGLYREAQNMGIQLQGRFQTMVLESCSEAFWKDGVMRDHRQGRLRNLRWPWPNPPRDPPPGFIDYAANLVHLSEDQLALRVRGWNGQLYGLREALWFPVFKAMQVYDTAAHMEAAQRVQGRAIFAVSLEENSPIFRGLTQDHGEAVAARSIPLFPAVAWLEREKGSLYPQGLDQALRAQKEYNEAARELQQLQRRKADVEARLAGMRVEDVKLGQAVEDVKQQLQRLRVELGNKEREREQALEQGRAFGLSEASPSGQKRPRMCSPIT